MPDSIELTAATEPQKAGIRAALEALKKDAAEVTAELQDETLDPPQPERISKERIPLEMEVDWFTCTNQAGNVIPANSYGQKEGVPFFGDAPLRDQLRALFSTIASLTVDSVKLYELYLGSYSVPAVEAVAGTTYLFEADIVYDDGANGLLPSSSTQKIYLWAKVGASTPVLVQGGRIEISVTAAQQRLKFRGQILFEESAGIIRVALGASQVEKMTSPDRTTASVILHNAELTTGVGAYLAVPAGEATTVEFYLLCNSTVTDFALGTIAINMTVYSGETGNSNFE